MHDRFYAHTLPGQPDQYWEPLDEHLRNVAELAGCFAAAFGAGEWGELAGLWHDLGKYSVAFQDYLRKTAPLAEDDPHRLELRGTVDHSTAGAVHAETVLGMLGRPMAYCIAGHHSGLPNSTAADGERQRTGLDHRLKHLPAEATDALGRAPAQMLAHPRLAPPSLKLIAENSRSASFQIGFFVRMLFSCLVDADFLCTERFLRRERADARPATPPSMQELALRLDEHIRGIQRSARDSHVNQWRNRVLRACIEAAAHRPGLFALTVPTGGGKTLSSLAFALHHARQHRLRRVIIAIPFTSIIEQNAAVYRRALGDLSEHVLEHHSNLDVRSDDAQSVRSRLAAENWDAPVVVTTNVQLLESLFAARTSRCRKLHRIAGSVIILDEAQALPPNLLAPTLAALRELVLNYGCSVVLCTATQPALEQRDEFPIGFESPCEIIDPRERTALFDALKRVEVKPPETLDDEALVERLAAEPRVLCVVNTRAHAAGLFDKLTMRLGETDIVFRRGREQRRVGTCLHLSASMCARHRTAVLRLIRRRLETGRPCRVISTQLVEAGVDIDFPVVFRALAGLDSVAQAAGRCNREGRLETGRVLLFEPDRSERRPPQFILPAINAARQVLPDHDDLLSPAAQHHYFRLHYWDEGARSNWDRPPGTKDGGGGVLDCFSDSGGYLQFRQAAERYRLIVDDQQPVLVPYGRRGRALIAELRSMRDCPGIGFDRRLQRYMVGMHRHGVGQLMHNLVLGPVEDTHGRLVLDNTAAYDRLLGLRLDFGGMEPESLFV